MKSNRQKFYSTAVILAKRRMRPEASVRRGLTAGSFGLAGPAVMSGEVATVDELVVDGLEEVAVTGSTGLASSADEGAAGSALGVALLLRRAIGMGCWSQWCLSLQWWRTSAA